MKTKLIVAGLLVLGMAMAPGALADHTDESDESVGDFYLVVGDDSVEIWEETNDHAGLQTSADAVVDDPDTQVL